MQKSGGIIDIKCAIDRKYWENQEEDKPKGDINKECVYIYGSRW